LIIDVRDDAPSWERRERTGRVATGEHDVKEDVEGKGERR